MFRLDDISTIIPEGIGIPQPDVEEIRRTGESYLRCSHSAEVACCWLERIENPFIRLFDSNIFYRQIEEYSVCDDPDYSFRSTFLEDLLTRLMKLIRAARNECIVWMDRMKSSVKEHCPDMQIHDQPVTAELQSMEDRIVQRVLQRLKAATAEPDSVVPSLCPYINTAHEYRTPEEIDAIIREKSGHSAPSFAYWLMHEALRCRYIDTGHDNVKSIFLNLDKHYHLGYSYANFAKYFSLGKK